MDDDVFLNFNHVSNGSSAPRPVKKLNPNSWTAKKEVRKNGKDKLAPKENGRPGGAQNRAPNRDNPNTWNQSNRNTESGDKYSVESSKNKDKVLPGGSKDKGSRSALKENRTKDRSRKHAGKERGASNYPPAMHLLKTFSSSISPLVRVQGTRWRRLVSLRTNFSSVMWVSVT